MSYFLDIRESSLQKGHFLYSVEHDKIFKISEVDRNAGNIYFEDSDHSMSLNYYSTETMISDKDYYLVPKYVVKHFQEQAPEVMDMNYTKEVFQSYGYKRINI